MTSNRRFTILTFICLLVPVAAGCGGWSDHAAPPPTQAGIVLRHIDDGTSDIAYPVVTGLAGSSAEAAINSAIHDLIFSFVDSTVADFENTDRSADPRDPHLEIGVDYLVGVNAAGILSIRFTLYWYAGGAHPMSYLRGLTVDLATGRELLLSDLFVEDSGYVETVSAVVAEGFAGADMPMLTEFERIGPDNEYYLTGEGIVVFYQRYEYMPYAYGFPEFTFSYDKAGAVGLKPTLVRFVRAMAEVPVMQ